MEVILFSCIPKGVPPFATTCVTSIVGALLLFAAFYRRAIEACRMHWRKLLSGCLGLAILSAVYNTLFLYGMKSFDIASGAFTICMTVVVLPVVLLTMHRKIALKTWISVFFVCTGIVLALGRTLHVKQLAGLGVMGVGCLIRAVFIVLLADFAKKYDPLSIAIFLELFAGGYSLLGWLCDEPRLFFALSYSRTLVATWTIYSYFIVAISQALNTFAMKRVTAANATIIYSMEIVFTIIWSVVLPASLIEQVKLTPFILLGILLVIIGSLAEIMDSHENETAKEEGIV